MQADSQKWRGKGGGRRPLFSVVLQGLFLALFLAPAVAHAQGAPATVPAPASPIKVPTPQEKAQALERLHKGMSCYDELNYGCARNEFEAGLALDETAQLHQYMAFTLVALGQENEAIEHFIRVFELDPNYGLSNQKVSPKIYRVYRISRRRYAAQKEAQQQTLLADSRAKIDEFFGGFVDPIQEAGVSWYGLDLAYRWYFEPIVGFSLVQNEEGTKKRGTLEGGLMGGAQVLFGPNEHIAFGPEIRYSSHYERGLPGPISVDLLKLGGRLRIQDYTETFRFFIECGGGALFAGRDSIRDEKGWYVTPGAGVSAIVTDKLSLGVASGVSILRGIEDLAGNKTIFEVPILLELTYLY